MVTSCHGVAPTAQLLVNLSPRLMPARVASVDEKLGLCKLAAEGVGSHPLAMSGAMPRAGETVYATKVNAVGEVSLIEGRITRIVAEPHGNIIDATIPVVPERAGGPLLDVHGRVVAVASFSHADGKGRHMAMPHAWVSDISAPPSAPPAAAPRRDPRSHRGGDARIPPHPESVEDIPRSDAKSSKRPSPAATVPETCEIQGLLREAGRETRRERRRHQKAYRKLAQSTPRRLEGRQGEEKSRKSPSLPDAQIPRSARPSTAGQRLSSRRRDSPAARLGAAVPGTPRGQRRGQRRLFLRRSRPRGLVRGPVAWPGAGRSRGNAQVPGEDYEVTVQLPLEDAYRGTQVDLNLSVPQRDPQGRVRHAPKTIKARIPKGYRRAAAAIARAGGRFERRARWGPVSHIVRSRMRSSGPAGTTSSSTCRSPRGKRHSGPRWKFHAGRRREPQDSAGHADGKEVAAGQEGLPKPDAPKATCMRSSRS